MNENRSAGGPGSRVARLSVVLAVCTVTAVAFGGLAASAALGGPDRPKNEKPKEEPKPSDDGLFDGKLTKVKDVAEPAIAAIAGLGVLFGAGMLGLGQTGGGKIIGLSASALLAIPLGHGVIELIG